MSAPGYHLRVYHHLRLSLICALPLFRHDRDFFFFFFCSSSVVVADRALRVPTLVADCDSCACTRRGSNLLFPPSRSLPCVCIVSEIMAQAANDAAAQAKDTVAEDEEPVGSTLGEGLQREASAGEDEEPGNQENNIVDAPETGKVGQEIEIEIETEQLKDDSARQEELGREEEADVKDASAPASDAATAATTLVREAVKQFVGCRVGPERTKIRHSLWIAWVIVQLHVLVGEDGQTVHLRRTVFNTSV